MPEVRILAACTAISMVGCGDITPYESQDETTLEPPITGAETATGDAYTPHVVLAVPASAATVRPEVVIKLLFSTPMDTEASTTAFSVVDEDGERVTGALNWDVTGMVSAFRPELPLAVGLYDVHVDPSACSTDGVALTVPFSTHFRVHESSGDDKPYAG